MIFFAIIVFTIYQIVITSVFLSIISFNHNCAVLIIIIIMMIIIIITTTGYVTISAAIPNPTNTMCGWLWKVSDSVLSSAWKVRWFLLLGNIFFSMVIIVVVFIVIIIIIMIIISTAQL